MIKQYDKNTVILFGTGDINIVSGILKEEAGIVCLRNQEPREIGLNNGDKPSQDLNDYTVTLQFNKIESIDVLIHSLTEVREMMQNRNKVLEESGCDINGI